MEADKRLYRSRDALVGGVCAGIASYFNIDPVVVRIIAVAVTLLSSGLLGLVYLALWILLPTAPDPAGPLDVEPQSVHSDTYGPVDYSASEGGHGTRSSSEAARAASRAYAARGTSPYYEYQGVGHEPPVPPAGARPAGVPGAPPYGSAPGAPYYTAPYAAPPMGTPPAGPAPTGGPSAAIPPASTPPVAPTGSPAPVAPAPVPPPAVAATQPSVPAKGGGAKALLWIGFILLGIGLSALLGYFIEGMAAWRFWPLVIVIIGIGQMVIPAEPGRRMRRFVGGATTFCLGVMLLLMSLDILRFATLWNMVVYLWPLLVVMGGFSLIGAATKSWVWALAGGVCFVAFCAVGLMWYAISGSTEFIVLTMPYGRSYLFDINPWL